MSLYPVLVYDEGVELPTQGTFYIIAGNGAFIHKDMGIVHGFMPVPSIPILPDVQGNIRVGCRLPLLPERDVHRIKEFFRRVVSKHRSEACVLLYYNKQDQKYFVYVPKQHVTHGSVKYKRNPDDLPEEIKSYLQVGTIHSHCDFGAFHSSTDIGDEKDFDGLHITFGHNDRSIFTITCSIVMNGHRAEVPATRYLMGLNELTPFTEKGKGFLRLHQEQQLSLKEVPQETLKEWFSDIDEKWMPQIVDPSVRIFSQRRQTAATLEKYDRVTWQYGMWHLEDACGRGPYEVQDVNKGIVTIKTQYGMAQFAADVFRRVDTSFAPRAPWMRETLSREGIFNDV